MSITRSSTRSSLVTHKPTSVAPATIRASGCSSRSSARASTVRRGMELAPRIADRDGRVVLQGLQAGDRIRALGCQPIGRAPAQLQHAMRGRDDRRIARAAAEVAGERVVDPLRAQRGGAVVGLGVVLVEREQRHHEAGRAEAALRAVALDHRPLHGVRRAVRAGEVLDRQQLAAVQLADEPDAGVDRLVADAPVSEPPDRDRAGAAVALVAALLGAGPPLDQAQPVEHGQGRVDPIELPQLLAEQKSDLLAHGLASPSAATIGRIAERRNEKWHVIVPRRVGDPEADRHAVEEGGLGQGQPAAPEIVADVEQELIHAGP